ncbi:laccase-4 isoform X2 [Orussus abietinus]|nr:laccase-4 isoform X2 [Orussus abietinus]XP_012286273.1 laccase-4 isoform X2 [Orussus abietinus]XP_012286274.1 laccase-4 isoform X2 [Orussus abietinus]
MIVSIVAVLISSEVLINSGSAETVITADHGLSWNVQTDEKFPDEIDWENHPCRRTCQENAPPMECHYEFRVEAYYTMSKACYDCPFNYTDCFRPHCVAGDGVERPLIVVNRQMPGPSIEVCQGDRLIIDVTNMMPTESTTIHWHGQQHPGTPYMDGVPYVTQCPILPGATFRYHYTAATSGTHFWHSHSGFHRGDGVFGALIVRVPPSRDHHKDLYDYDEHNLVILDWLHESGVEKFLAHHHANGDNKSPNLLVNGLGRFKPIQSENGTLVDMPVAVVSVKQNFRYRLRIINAEFLNCPIEVSIDNHTIYVVSSDGNDFEPIEAESVVTYAGERFDVIVEMNQDVGNYWIRFRGLMDCDERFLSAYQVAILRYEGAPEIDPKETVSYERVPTTSDALQVNTLNQGMETDTVISVPLLDSLDPDDESNTRKPDYQFYISYDFYDKDNPDFHRKNLYGFHQVKDKRQRLFTPQLNHITLKLPPYPLLSQRDSISTEQFCNASTVEGCVEDFCACTHVLQVKLGSVVELVLVDKGFTFDANHPFHLHGHSFRVVSMARVGKNVTVEEVKNLDKRGLIHRKLKRAPIKDTVTVPDGGYTILRFHANNPGYWIFHCHIEFHVELGMALIFKIGEHEEFPPVPRDFPKCGNWLPSGRPEITGELWSKFLTSTTEVLPHENEVDDTRPTKISFMTWIPLIFGEFKASSSASCHAVGILILVTCLIISPLTS